MARAKPGGKLTDKQRRFAALVAEGQRQTDAYLEVFPNARRWTKDTLRVTCSHLATTPQVAAKIDEFRKAAEDDAILRVTHAKIILSDRIREIVKDKGSTKDLCRAVDSLAKICGWVQPDAFALQAVVITQEEREKRIRDALGITDVQEEVKT